MPYPFLAPPIVSFGGVSYICSPDGKALVKAARKPGGRNWRESTEYTDEKGRKWLFNETTRRWGLHPDHKKQKGKGKKKSKPTEAEMRQHFKENDPEMADILNQVDDANQKFDEAQEQARSAASDIRGMSDSIREGLYEWQEDIDQFGEDSEDDYVSDAQKEQQAMDADMQRGDFSAFADPPADRLPEKLDTPVDAFNDILPFNLKRKDALEKFIDGLTEIMREVQASNIQGKVLAYRFDKELSRRAAIAALNNAFQERISTDQAKVVALNKHLFETLHPRKIIRVPAGTTQIEYANIVKRLAEGDRKAMKQYTVAKPKGYKTAVDRKMKREAEATKAKGKPSPKTKSKSTRKPRK